MSHSAEKDARPDCNWTRCVRAKRTDGKCFHWCKCRCHTHPIPAQQETLMPDSKNALRELTVGRLIERLQELPSHHYVSPMVDGVLGAGIDVWQMFDPQTHDTLVVFGESKPLTPPIVPPSWSRVTPPGGDHV